MDSYFYPSLVGVSCVLSESAGPGERHDDQDDDHRSGLMGRARRATGEEGLPVVRTPRGARPARPNRNRVGDQAAREKSPAPPGWWRRRDQRVTAEETRFLSATESPPALIVTPPGPRAYRSSVPSTAQRPSNRAPCHELDGAGQAGNRRGACPSFAPELHAWAVLSRRSSDTSVTRVSPRTDARGASVRPVVHGSA
jgi:hypothetical protein